jgi:hypothetical protein
VMVHTTRDASVTAPNFLMKRILRIVPLYRLALLWATRRQPPDLDLVKDFFFIPALECRIPRFR